MVLKKIFLSFIVFLYTFASASSLKAKTYTEQKAWKDLQNQLPEQYRLTNENAP